jgi:hypothetical protein
MSSRPAPLLPDRSALRDALRRLGRADAEAPLEPLPDKGLAHLHLRVVGSGLLLRCPKQSQLGLAPQEHLAYEAACFERAAPSGHTPRLHGVLAPAPGLPRGALLVDEVAGRMARLPEDLPAIAEALAALHRLPLPPQSGRAPLIAPERPLVALLEEIERQAAHLDAAAIEPDAIGPIRAGLQHLREHAAAADQPPVRLIAFDGHPGNYVVRADGRAMLVDLEKARYSAPPLDLAHASLYTSTTWDAECHAVLDAATLVAFHRHWLECLPEGLAWRHWIAPLRRAMWLWSVTWCAKWRALSSRSPSRAASGEDWSSQLSDQALIAHVRDRVDHYLSPAVVALACTQADALEATFSAT